jgi:hydrogenase/urease accessory protein HupE
MRSKFLITLTAVLALILSFPVFAHITETSDGWAGALLHPFTGIDHLLMLLFIGVAIVYNVRKFRKLDK